MCDRWCNAVGAHAGAVARHVNVVCGLCAQRRNVLLSDRPQTIQIEEIVDQVGIGTGLQLAV